MAGIVMGDHAELFQGLQDLRDGFLRLAFVVARQGAWVHGGSFELVADGADLGLQSLGPGLFFGDLVFWCFGRGVGGVFVAGGEFALLDLFFRGLVFGA